jgi:enamine deaminase RidA (YjgF/YER057c/UK114 family)
MTHNVYDQLAQAGITLPPVATPAAAYLPYAQAGKMIFLSGHIAKKQTTTGNAVSVSAWVGKLGETMATAEGVSAARAVAIDLLGTLHAACQAAGTDLNGVKRIVKVMSLVNSAPTFTEQHLVSNGCSELIAQIFGNAVGGHARSAFGVAQIPLGACVEIELIAELA